MICALWHCRIRHNNIIEINEYTCLSSEWTLLRTSNNVIEVLLIVSWLIINNRVHVVINMLRQGGTICYVFEVNRYEQLDVTYDWRQDSAVSQADCRREDDKRPKYTKLVHTCVWLLIIKLLKYGKGFEVEYELYFIIWWLR